VHVAAILITTIPVFALAAAIVARTRARLGVSHRRHRARRRRRVAGRRRRELQRDVALGARRTMIVINCLSYALYLVLSKPSMARLSAKRVVARMFAVGTVVMLPISAIPL
jgi:hypothetical protein